VAEDLDPAHQRALDAAKVTQQGRLPVAVEAGEPGHLAAHDLKVHRRRAHVHRDRPQREHQAWPRRRRLANRLAAGGGDSGRSDGTTREGGLSPRSRRVGALGHQLQQPRLGELGSLEDATHLPIAQHDDLIADPLDLLETVGGEDHHGAGGGTLREDGERPFGIALVEGGGRLVEQEDAGSLLAERPGDDDELPLSQTELVHALANTWGVRRQRGQGGLSDLDPTCCRGPLAEPAPVGEEDVVEDAQIVLDEDLLETRCDTGVDRRARGE